MKKFIFTVDDNIRCFKEICERGYRSIFEHPYLNMYKILHEKYGAKVQLNLFFECEGFCLRDMTDKYREEWKNNSDWLKMSFHSWHEDVRPYESSGFGEVFFHCHDVNDEIRRFAGEGSLAKTTTIHYCALTENGLDAVSCCGYGGLLGLYGTEDKPKTSYQSTPDEAEKLRCGELVRSGKITYGAIDMVLNLFGKKEILDRLSALSGRETIKIMIHEQYFYKDYERYISEFEEILASSFEFLTNNGYMSEFFERLI